MVLCMVYRGEDVFKIHVSYKHDFVSEKMCTQLCVQIGEIEVTQDRKVGKSK